MSLRQKAIKGVFWSAFQNWGSSLISMVVILVLARLLDKGAFGLVAFASLFTMFLGVIHRAGFVQAIVQRADLQSGHLDTAFWTTTAVGLAMTGLLFGTAGWVLPLFDQSGLGPILQVLSLTIVIDAVGSTPKAILRREMAFRTLAARSLAASVVGGFVGVGMALKGYGVWSLVGQRVAASIAGTVALWAASRWRPRWNVSIRYFKDLFGFGAYAMGREVVGFFSRQTDELVVFAFLGADALGVYFIGRRLLILMNRLFTHTISSVALPTFSRLQHDHGQMRQALLTATRMASLLAFPAFAGVAMLAPELVSGLFGERWEESVPVMRILALAGIVHCVTFFNGPMIIACGKPSWMFVLTIINAVVGAAFYLIAVRWGVAAVAAAHLIRTYALAPLPVWLVRKLIGLKISDYLRQFAAPAAGALVMAAIVWAGKHGLAALAGVEVRLTMCIILGVAVYATAILWRAPGLARELSEFLRLALSLGGGKKNRQ